MSDLFEHRLHIQRALARLSRSTTRLFDNNRTVYVGDRVREYRDYWHAAATLLGAEFCDVSDAVWEIRRGEQRTRIFNCITEADDPVTLHLAGDKEHCIELARQVGLPVATLGVYTLSEIARSSTELLKLGGPFVVKPSSRSSAGIGITTGVRTRRQLKRAGVLASLFSERILVERMVHGESCRLLYLDGEFIHAVRRTGVRVIGDGKKTIGQLLAQRRLSQLMSDPHCKATLKSSGLTFNSIPSDGVSTVVRHLPLNDDCSRELRTVYTETITDQIGASLRQETTQLVQAFRGCLIAVDILTNNVGVSLADSNGVFLELNTTPGLHHHYHTPEERREHPVTVKVLEHLLHHSTFDVNTNEIPSICSTGYSGKGGRL